MSDDAVGSVERARAMVQCRACVFFEVWPQCGEDPNEVRRGLEQLGAFVIPRKDVFAVFPRKNITSDALCACLVSEASNQERLAKELLRGQTRNTFVTVWVPQQLVTA